MWSRFFNCLIALLLAELLLIEPPLQAMENRDYATAPSSPSVAQIATILLAQASGYDAGIAVGNTLYNQFGSSTPTPPPTPSDPWRGQSLSDNANSVMPMVIPPTQDPACGTDLDCITTQSLGNPYYTDDPQDSARRNRLGQDVATGAQASDVPGNVTQTIQGRATSPYSWSFGATSTLVDSIQRTMPSNLTADSGCRSIPFCAQPTTTSTEQTCTLTQSFDQMSCTETWAIIDNQPPVFTDGCATYKQSPWFARESVCLDAPDTPRCRPYQQTRQYTSCIDHWLDIGLSQEGNTIVLQKWDATPGTHSNCGADSFELDHIPIETFDGPPSITVTATGPCNGSATVALGDRIRLFDCTQSYHKTNTITWTGNLVKCLDCWSRKRTFGKFTTESSTCGPLEAGGCTPTGQECLTEDCAQANKTYTCQTPGECGQWKPAVVCSACIPDPPNPPRCIDETYPPNSDFGIAAAAMEGSVTMAKDKDGGPKFFPGEVQECKDNALVDCCGSGETIAADIMKGIEAAELAYSVISKAVAFYQAYQAGQTAWQLLSTVFMGASLTFAVIGVVVTIAIQVLMTLIQCTEKDIEASTKKELRVCHRIGRYCSVKALICLEHNTAYCCFSTVLARIIQEQARAQLGISWGDPEDPDCRGLTATELQTVDWSKIDLTEYLQDLSSRMAWPDATSSQTASDQAAAVDLITPAGDAVINSGSLARRVQGDIAPPGGWTITDTSRATLTVTVLGSGTVTVSPGNGSCSASTCQLSVPADQPLTITATALAGSTFSGWSGLCTGTHPCTATIATAASLTATFTATNVLLAISIAGQGTVTIASSAEGVPASQTCSPPSCTFSFPPSADVTLTATPTAPASTFTSWGGACTGIAPCALTLIGSKSVIASFSGTPVITSLTADVTFPVPAGTIMTWTASTTGGSPPVQYRYIRVDGGTDVLVQDWSTFASYTWTTTPSSVGDHTLKLLVRNSGSPADFEDYRETPTFTIMPPLQVTSASPSSGSRGTLVTVTLSGDGFRTGDSVFFTRTGNPIPGITVSGVTAPSPTQLTFTLTIDIAASTGFVDITVADPAGTSATGLSLFTITP